MGGTFDPIHHGHLVAAAEVQALFDLDEVLFVPTGQPWQKDAATVSPAELDRAGPTHTIDTLRDLRNRLPDSELFFITGADALAQILSWKDIDELWDLAHFIGVTRPGHLLSDYGLPEDRVTLQVVPALAISSTDCRARVLAGEPVLVPDGVVQYIAKHRLYRSDEVVEPARAH
jgi:nicotinate-nucleotide adenylyltransferase